MSCVDEAFAHAQLRALASAGVAAHLLDSTLLLRVALSGAAGARLALELAANRTVRAAAVNHLHCAVTVRLTCVVGSLRSSTWCCRSSRPFRR